MSLGTHVLHTKTCTFRYSTIFVLACGWWPIIIKNGGRFEKWLQFIHSITERVRPSGQPFSKWRSYILKMADTKAKDRGTRDFGCPVSKYVILKSIVFINNNNNNIWTYYSARIRPTKWCSRRIITPAHNGGHTSFLKPSQLPGEYTAQLLPLQRI